MAYDIESLLVDVQAILASNLNTKISAINSEKNDTISLGSIDSNAYFMQSMDAEQANYDPYVVYSVIDIDDEADRANFSRAVTNLQLAVVIVVSDEGNDVNISKRMFRYGRALKEVFTENFNSISEGVKLSVQSQVPVNLALINDSFTHRAVGVTLRASMG
jgi:hypothetical protein